MIRLLSNILINNTQNLTIKQGAASCSPFDTGNNIFPVDVFRRCRHGRGRARARALPRARSGFTRPLPLLPPLPSPPLRLGEVLASFASTSAIVEGLVRLGRWRSRKLRVDSCVTRAAAGLCDDGGNETDGGRRPRRGLLCRGKLLRFTHRLPLLSCAQFELR